MRSEKLPIWNPFLAESISDPNEQLRIFREQNPVHRGINGRWVLFKYSDVKTILEDPRFQSVAVHDSIKEIKRRVKSLPGLDSLGEMVSKWLLFLDPPEHTQVRSLIAKVWSIEDVAAIAEKLVDERLEEIAANDKADLVADYATQIPGKIITKLLGFPIEDFDRLMEWSSAFSRVLEQFETFAKLEVSDQKAKDFYDYADKILDRRAESPKQDLISRLLAENRRSNSPLRRFEIISILSVLLVAGTENVVNLIGQSALHLLNNPEQKAMLLSDKSIESSAVEEFLRYASPAQFVARRALEEAEIGGHTIKEGEIILGSLASANRDSAIFENPDDLNLARKPNPHLAFGYGFHFCLGAAMARIEASIAIPALFKRFPKLALDDTDKAKWVPRQTLRGLESLPVILT